jgi:hypothetical protein
VLFTIRLDAMGTIDILWKPQLYAICSYVTLARRVDVALGVPFSSCSGRALAAE